MAIHPIEFRYGTPEMKKIWEEENKLQKMLDVESALAQAEGKLGIIPQEVADEIAAKGKKLKLKPTTILQHYQNQLLKFVKMALENMFISELHPMTL